MSDTVRLITLVLIGGLIGYITNKVAIKMLFRPVNPVKILFIKSLLLISRLVHCIIKY